MNNREAIQNWGIIIAILIGGALITAIWPFLNPEISETAATQAIPQEETLVEITIPEKMGTISLPNGGSEITLTGFQAFGILVALIVGAVVSAGLVFGIIYRFLDKRVVTVAASEEHKETVQTLERREKERIKQIREGRVVISGTDGYVSRWSTISTILTILMFVAFFGYVINGVLVPNGEIILAGNIVSSSGIIVSILIVGTLIVLAALSLISYVVYGQRKQGSQRL